MTRVYAEVLERLTKPLLLSLDMKGCLEVCQKRCEELAAILWIQLKINGSCRRGQKGPIVE